MTRKRASTEIRGLYTYFGIATFESIHYGPTDHGQLAVKAALLRGGPGPYSGRGGQAPPRAGRVCRGGMYWLEEVECVA